VSVDLAAAGTRRPDPDPAGDTGGPIGPTARARARGWSRALAIGSAALLVALLVGLLTAGGPRRYLDPSSAAPEGARALRVLLEQQGVRVSVATDTAAAETAARGTTLFVADVTRLSVEDLTLLLSTSADLVVTDPDAGSIPRLLPGTEGGDRQRDQVRDPACGLPAAIRAGPALTGGLAVTGQPLSGTLDACYAAGGEGTLVRQQLTGGRTVTLVGSGTAFTNAALGDDGNAALALNLLGAHQQLVWYMPPLTPQTGGGQSSLSGLLPPWVGLAVAQLAVCALVAALWRGRRLGPVVTEPLPVRVRAAETTEGRARLYRRRGARGRAAEHLRAATLARLLPALGQPDGGPEATVATVSARSGWSPTDVAALLYGAAPRDDVALVRLVSDLDSLERQVRRP
jgi:Domain of unknown function (DUF4350)